jgi:phage-related protein
LHEPRVNDETKTWRIMVRVDSDAILIIEVFAKKTPKTPPEVIEACKRRLRAYDKEK